MNAQTLESVRPSLIQLLTALLDAERIEREKAQGRLPAGAWLAIVLDDETLAWLRPLSRLIAGLDHAMAEAVKNEAPLAPEAVLEFVSEARRFLTPGPRYLDLLQAHPTVVLAHRDAVKSLPPLPGGPTHAPSDSIAP